MTSGKVGFMFARYAVVFLTAALGGSVFAAGAVAGMLALDLKSESDSLVLREPVKFTLTISNPSAEAERIVGISHWGTHMTDLFLEITDPHGARHRRWYLLFHQASARLPGYRGEALIPGDSWTSFIYPTMSFDVRDDGQPSTPSGTLDDQLFTFPEAGTYEVRACYIVWYEHLWQPPGGQLCSNTITIHVGAATETENEILDAYWTVSGSNWYVSEELDVFDKPGFDERRLKHVVAAYPDNRLTNYARYALVRSQINNGTTDDALSGIQELERLSPGFRTPELVLRKGLALVAKDKKSDAFDVVGRFLHANPGLADWEPLMMVYVSCDPSNSNADPLAKWLADRIEGTDEYRQRFKPTPK